MDKVWIPVYCGTAVLVTYIITDLAIIYFPTIYVANPYIPITIIPRPILNPIYDGSQHLLNSGDTMLWFNDSTITTEDNNKTTKKIILDSDPSYPMLFQEGHIPVNSTGNGTIEEEGISYETPNVTCIRRDYEQNISAIFLDKVGPILNAWNIFNKSIEYGYFTVQNIENIGHIEMLNETFVDCDEYDFEADDKGIKPVSANTANSLLGGIGIPSSQKEGKNVN